MSSYFCPTRISSLSPRSVDLCTLISEPISVFHLSLLFPLWMMQGKRLLGQIAFLLVAVVCFIAADLFWCRLSLCNQPSLWNIKSVGLKTTFGMFYLLNERPQRAASSYLSLTYNILVHINNIIRPIILLLSHFLGKGTDNT